MLNTLRPRQDDRHFPDDFFKYIFLNENVWISVMISLKFVPKGSINNILSSVQIMAWCRSGDKLLSEPMMISLLTHICVTRPQWVNTLSILRSRQNGRSITDIFKPIFFVTEGPINPIPALLQIMAWCRPGEKPLSDPMLTWSPTLVCVSWSQWVNAMWNDKLWNVEPYRLNVS